MNQLKAVFQALAHAAVGGFAAGVAGVAAGATWKQILAAGIASAITSVFSLRTLAK